MLCVAKVSFPGWPLGEARDVDETTEEILGKLRAHYIAPLTKPRSDQTRPTVAAPEQTARVEDGPETTQAASGARKRARGRSS